MTEPLIDDDAIEHEEVVDLACLIENDIQGLNAATAIFALCWVLASLILQGESEKRLSAAHSITMVGRQLATCVARLRELAPSTQIH